METAKVELPLPSVSVIVAAYNEQAFIETTVASIEEPVRFAQRLPWLKKGS